MAQTIYVGGLAAFLLLSALAHFFLPSQTSDWLARPGIVRSIGALLLLLTVPCASWRGWYFWTLFVALFVSGAWRLCFPHHSIRAQEKSYPRWVHGWLLLAGSLLVFALNHKRYIDSTPRIQPPASTASIASHAIANASSP
jgi:hypothetical protein